MTGVRTRVDGGVAVVTLDRPEVRNALDWAAWEALGRAVEECDRDDVRAVVLTGGDRWFSAGGDVSSMGQGADGGVAAPAARVRVAHRAVRALTRCRVPVVAAVEGFAVGAAWGLVLACDLVVASREAFFAAPFNERGLVADAGLAWSLPRHLGHQRAAELLLLGERLPAPRAHELGLVTRLAEPGQAGNQALALAARLAAGPADAVRLTKGLLNRAPTSSLDAFLDDEYVHVALNGHSPDVAEGRQAFLDKRPPRFR
ncbi:enoyl-CoA hydratase/isomerase family protein [Blastococcus deserti]|uniref:Enoyl-CoA hydratase/isomerase family protein n=1 Tax=Blastococcus deserti TaxID=2259033 RepID=A0ABW4X5P5_9ACTN